MADQQGIFLLDGGDSPGMRRGPAAGGQSSSGRPVAARGTTWRCRSRVSVTTVVPRALLPSAEGEPELAAQEVLARRQRHRTHTDHRRLAEGSMP